jgi:hypothetical protein
MKFNRDNTIPILVKSVETALKNGCFLRNDATVLQKAIAYFDKTSKETIDFGTETDTESIAISLLLQGCAKAQVSKICPYNLDEAAKLCEIVEFWSIELGK